jgi:hypothetical protein
LIRCNEPAPCNAHVDPAHRNVDVDFYDIFRQVVWLARQVLQVFDLQLSHNPKLAIPFSRGAAQRVKAMQAR